MATGHQHSELKWFVTDFMNNTVGYGPQTAPMIRLGRAAGLPSLRSAIARCMFFMDQDGWTIDLSLQPEESDSMETTREKTLAALTGATPPP